MPESLPEPAVQRIRALCRELSARHVLDDEAREELCGHMEEKLLGYLSGQVKVTEEDAIFLVRAHFGDAGEIARQIRRERAGGSGDRFLSAGVNHDRLYSVLLVVLALGSAFNIPLGLIVWGMRQLDPANHPVTRIPPWLIPAGAVLSAVYLIAITITLTARRLNPDAGRRLTRSLNYALLVAPPFGTILGLYGLLKLDRTPRGAVA